MMALPTEAHVWWRGGAGKIQATDLQVFGANEASNGFMRGFAKCSVATPLGCLLAGDVVQIDRNPIALARIVDIYEEPFEYPGGFTIMFFIIFDRFAFNTEPGEKFMISVNSRDEIQPNMLAVIPPGIAKYIDMELRT